MKNETNKFEDKEILTSKEAAEFLSIGRQALYNHTRNGDIPYFKPGGKINYFFKSDLIEWIKNGKVDGRTNY
mgnify:CR=1 FL=1|jgi:excisionase family DNA binding protein